MKNVLVTGSAGFVGKNLVETLRLREDVALTTFDIEDDPSTLLGSCLPVLTSSSIWPGLIVRRMKTNSVRAIQA